MQQTNKKTMPNTPTAELHQLSPTASTSVPRVVLLSAPRVVNLLDEFGADIIDRHMLTPETVDWVTLVSYVDSNRKTEKFLSEATRRIAETTQERLEYISFPSPAHGGNALFHIFFRKIPCTRVIKGNRITVHEWAMYISFARSSWPERSETSQKSQNRDHAALYEALWDIETLLDTELEFLRGVDGKKLRVEKFRIKKLELSQNRYFEDSEDLIAEYGSKIYSEQVAIEFAEKLERLKQKCPHLEMIERPHFETMEGPHLDMINQTVSFGNDDGFHCDDEYREALYKTSIYDENTILIRTKLYRPYKAEGAAITGYMAQLQCFECMQFEVSFRTRRNSLKYQFPLSVEKLFRIEGK